MRPRAGVAVLLHDTKALRCSDGLQDREAVLLVVAARPQAPPRGERCYPGEVSVELGREEAGAAHLTIRDDVDASLLLVAQGKVDGIVLDLADVRGAKLAAFGGGHRQLQPGWAGVRSTDGRGERGGLVGMGHVILLGLGGGRAAEAG